jgi:putative isomerase
MSYDHLYDHIERTKDHLVREPEGLLPYRYIIPSAPKGDVVDRQHGVYLQQYDWDTFFVGIALLYDGGDRAAAFRDAMRNFLHFTSVGGYTPRTISPEKFWDFPDQMKPFLAQGCLLASRALGDFGWLEGEDYGRLAANLDYWDANRRGAHGLYMWRSSLESGVDNNAPTVNLPDLSVESVDVNAYLVREYLAAAEIATALERADDAERYTGRSHELARRLNAVMWDDEDECYYDLFSVADEPFKRIKIKAWTCLTPLWAGAATPERAAALVERHVLNEAEFWGPFGVPSLARDERLYNQAKRATLYIDFEKRRWEVSNWQGPVWVVTNWQVMHGLLRYGYAGQARELAERVVSLLARDVTASGGMHENYDAETGRALWAENFGSWDLLARHMIDEAETGHDPARIGHQSRSR